VSNTKNLDISSSNSSGRPVEKSFGDLKTVHTLFSSVGEILPIDKTINQYQHELIRASDQDQAWAVN
jgi:hypothetical protein